MAKDNINQELTRHNIIELREKHQYTQAQVAEMIGGSRTTYNGIENGKVKITEYYVQTLADIYHVSFESIAVFASGYDEGFYQGMKAKSKLDESQFDSQSMKVYHMGKELLTGKKYTSTLYPSLKAMGYTIEVVDMEELDPVNVPPEVKDNVPDGKVFVISKGNRCIGYIAPSEYYTFERFLNTAINGYLDEVNESYKKAERNPSDMRIMYEKKGRFITKKKTFPRIYKDLSSDESGKNMKYSRLFKQRRSPQDIYSADKQMKQLKNELRTHGIQEMNDDDDE